MAKAVATTAELRAGNLQHGTATPAFLPGVQAQVSETSTATGHRSRQAKKDDRRTIDIGTKTKRIVSWQHGHLPRQAPSIVHLVIGTRKKQSEVGTPKHCFRIGNLPRNPVKQAPQMGTERAPGEARREPRIPKPTLQRLTLHQRNDSRKGRRPHAISITPKPRQSPARTARNTRPNPTAKPAIDTRISPAPRGVASTSGRRASRFVKHSIQPR